MEKLINKILKSNKFLLKTSGTSMLPVLRSGDAVGYKKISFSKCHTNDIILAKKNGRTFTHRVIYKNQNYLVTCGDNNYISDGRIYPNQVIARVDKIKRNGQSINPQDINLFQSTIYFREIVKIKSAFRENNINYVFLKGLPLHLYFEKKHPDRLYSDCDLLVEKDDYEKAEGLFMKLRYRKSKKEFSSIHKYLKDKPTQFSFYKIINGFNVIFDVHLEPAFLMNQLGKLNELYPQKLIDELTFELLKAKKIIKVQNESFYILHTEYLILYLALHFFHHNYRGIHRLEMIDRVIRKAFKIPLPSGESLRATSPSVSLSLSRKINHYKVQNFVYPAFLMLKKYFDTPLPRGFLSSIKPEENKQRYNKKNIIKINVFDEDRRFQAGISRFKNIFFLSPESMYRKLFVFLNPAVAYSIFWVLYKRFISFLKLSFWKVNPIKAP